VGARWAGGGEARVHQRLTPAPREAGPTDAGGRPRGSRVEARGAVGTDRLACQARVIRLLDAKYTW
jgi:hypothetical protein